MLNAAEAQDSSRAWTGRVFATSASTFDAQLGRSSFTLANKLAAHPLFTPARLAQAAERALASGRGDRFAVAGANGSTGSTFADMGSRPKIAAAIADLENANAWMKLSTIQSYDSDYGDLLRDALADLGELAPELRSPSFAQLTVFLASPHVVTPFHVDHEHNFLSQIAGDKKRVCVFPPNDRDVLRQTEIESFYVNDINAVKYRPALQARGIEYALKPGMTVYSPPLAPHWVENGDDVSISLSLNLCVPPLEHRARVHQVNFFLRKLGLRPPEPRAGFPDSLKASLLKAVSKHRPTTYRDVVFSGVDRIQKPFVIARRLARKASKAGAA